MPGGSEFEGIEIGHLAARGLHRRESHQAGVAGDLVGQVGQRHLPEAHLGLDGEGEGHAGEFAVGHQDFGARWQGGGDQGDKGRNLMADGDVGRGHADEFGIGGAGVGNHHIERRRGRGAASPAAGHLGHRLAGGGHRFTVSSRAQGWPSRQISRGAHHRE